MKGVINELSTKTEKLTLRMDEYDQSVMELLSILSKHNQVLNYLHEELIKLKGVIDDGQSEQQFPMQSLQDDISNGEESEDESYSL
jgi:Mg2+ and Co2+ transporter CorA